MPDLILGVTRSMWRFEFTGPIWDVGAIGSHILIWETRSVTRSSTFLKRSSCSVSRLVHPHDCPDHAKFMAPMAASATLSGSESGQAMNGFLPPSSSDSDLMPPSA